MYETDQRLNLTAVGLRFLKFENIHKNTKKWMGE